MIRLVNRGGGVSLAVIAVLFAAMPASATELGIDGTRFTIDGEPTFLLGASYYGGLGASDEALKADLDALQKAGFNWIRVWATWVAFGEDFAAVDGEGRPRDAQLKKLQQLVAECDRRGMIVDVTISRGGGDDRDRLIKHEQHARAVETIVTALKEHRNWYLDLANERNIGDARHASIDELAKLRELVRRLDEKFLVTASQGGDIGRDELGDHLTKVKVDFITPHRPRHDESPGETAEMTRRYLTWMKDFDRVVPVHYQEPFRAGYSSRSWEPTTDDFLTDLKQAHEAGAAGWCFHNGDERGADDGRPRRSFDLRDGPLMEQLTKPERAVIERAAAVIAPK